VRLYGTVYGSLATESIGLTAVDGGMPVELVAPPVDPAAIGRILGTGDWPYGLRLGPELPPNRHGYRLVLAVEAAVCRGGGALSQTVADSPCPAGPDDPVLRRLIERIVLELFPPRRPDEIELF
jgi:hypothetical protein